MEFTGWFLDQVTLFKKKSGSLLLGCWYLNDFWIWGVTILLPTPHTHAPTHGEPDPWNLLLFNPKPLREGEIWHFYPLCSLSVSWNVVFTQSSGQWSSRLNKGSSPSCDVSADGVNSSAAGRCLKWPYCELSPLSGWSCLASFSSQLESLFSSHHCFPSIKGRVHPSKSPRTYTVLLNGFIEVSCCSNF